MTRFIDVHVHPPVPEYLDGPFGGYMDDLRRTFRRDLQPMSAEELADHYRSRDGKAVLLGWDAQSATRRAPFDNAQIAALVEQAPDVFIGFGSVDPNKGAAAVAGVHEASRLGLRGLKFHPGAQGFSPTDRVAYPIWEAAADLGLVCLVHTGYTGLGAGTRGGGGIRLGSGRPVLLDEVAAEFPELTIIAAHPAWPWQDEALALARHKTNVYLDLSGWSPKYFSSALVEAFTSDLSDRTLFGTDFPFLTADKWLADWEGLGIDDDVSRRILHDNAAALFDLDGGSTTTGE